MDNTEIENEVEFRTFRILKCHKCKRVWLYTGKSETYCICSGCRTSVYVGQRAIGVLWDETPQSIRAIVDQMPQLDPADHRKIIQNYGNKAVFYVDLYDREIRLGIDVYSEDLLNFRTIYLDDVMCSEEIGIEMLDLIESLFEPSNGLRNSGRYPLSPRLRDVLKLAVVG